jgi:ABC-type sugar transport system permease subunit
MTAASAGVVDRKRRQGGGLLGRSSRKDVRRRIGENPLTPYLFIAPHFAVFAIFILYPFFLGIWISVHDSSSLRDGPFVGANQFLKVLDPASIHFPRFWNTVKNTFLFVLMSVPMLVGVGLLLATLLNQRIRGRNIFRAIYFVPWTLSVAVVGLTWWWMFNSNAGFIPLLASFQLVGQPQIITGGGPPSALGGETAPVLLHIYQTGFEGRRELSFAAAMALIVAAMMIIVSVINFRLFSSERS